MNFKQTLALAAMALAATPLFGQQPVVTPRPVPSTRPEMKALLEDMKVRPYRVPLPQETTEAGTTGSYEQILRRAYIPEQEGTVFGSGRSPSTAGQGSPAPGNPSTTAPARDFRRNADENMTLSYQFKTMLFWIVSRTNNCQYCLGHQEWKLAATGMTDDAIASLDADWSGWSEQDQAAFRFARLLTYEPHLLSDQVIQELQQHFTPLQILEMTMSVSGNNSINRWKEGIGIPQSAGNTFAGRGGSVETSPVAHSETFLTETSEKYRWVRSIVAPVEIVEGSVTGRGIRTRPQLEPREFVVKKFEEAATRQPRLPLVNEETTAAWLAESGINQPVTNWIRLLANFPNEGRGRLAPLASREQVTGELTLLQKAQINWVIARQDRAWYALARAYRLLQNLGQTESQIFALDENRSSFSPADQALFTVAEHLASSPIALTDEEAQAALSATSPRQFVQLVNHVASCAYFNRVTEAAGLPLEAR